MVYCTLIILLLKNSVPVAFVDRMKSIFDCVRTSAAVLIYVIFARIRPMLSVAILSPFNAFWLASRRSSTG